MDRQILPTVTAVLARLGLVADGKGSQQFIGTVTSSAAAAQDNVTVNVGTGETRPYDGQIVFFDKLLSVCR